MENFILGVLFALFFPMILLFAVLLLGMAGLIGEALYKKVQAWWQSFLPKLYWFLKFIAGLILFLIGFATVFYFLQVFHVIGEL